MKKHKLMSLTALMLCAALAAPAYAAQTTRVVVTKNGVQGSTLTIKEPLTSISWDELDNLIREGSLNVLALEETIKSIDAIDYNQMKNDILKVMIEVNNAKSSINSVKTYLNALGESASEADYALYSMSSSTIISSLDNSYDSLKETYDSIKDGSMEDDNDDVIRQLEDAITQIVIAGETLYLSILTMEDSMEDAYRGISQLDMNIQEVKLRQQLGQVTEQDVMQLENTRRSTEDQIEILDMTIKTYKSQLQALIGEEPTGEIELEEPPEVTEADIVGIDYDEDLASAKAASWTMREAKISTNNAGDDWYDVQDEYEDWEYEYEVGEHTWNSAHLSYDATEQSFELSFKNLYNTLIQKQLVIASYEKTVEYYEKQLEITELKLDLGMVGYMDYIDALNDKTSAESDLNSAKRELLIAYNNYENAAMYGIVD
ncbi:MAG: TolC family protein [Clostridiales bacterium]|nr:TolC family protein [Clostridiales bacterium]